LVESVGDGAEEYDVGGTEPRGEWLGAGARELGLEGLVDGEALRRVLAGEDDEGEQLRASRAPRPTRSASTRCRASTVQAALTNPLGRPGPETITTKQSKEVPALSAA
jgi:hypothetical protein